MQNILITGSNGQLGRCLRDAVRDERYEVKGEKEESRKQKAESSRCSYAQNFFFTDIEELDITDINAVAKFIYRNKIDCVINTAAYTAVDKAEDEPEEAFAVNTEGVWNLAHICMEQNVFLIHISTDYVFDGKATKPYKTGVRPKPASIYGWSKFKGEREIFFSQIPSMIIRTSWLYSKYEHNFLKTMLKLGREKEEIFVVDDQYGVPTNAHDLAEAILNIIPHTNQITKPTIFHYTNEGVTTWYGFAKEIMKIAQLSCVVHPVSTSDYPTKAVRPAYSVLDLSKIKIQFHIQIHNWVDSLRRELADYGY